MFRPDDPERNNASRLGSEDDSISPPPFRFAFAGFVSLSRVSNKDHPRKKKYRPPHNLPLVYTRVQTRLPPPRGELVAAGLDLHTTYSLTPIFGRDVRRVRCLLLFRHGHFHEVSMLESLRVTSFASSQSLPPGFPRLLYM